MDLKKTLVSIAGASLSLGSTSLLYKSLFPPTSAAAPYDCEEAGTQTGPGGVQCCDAIAAASCERSNCYSYYAQAGFACDNAYDNCVNAYNSCRNYCYTAYGESGPELETCLDDCPDPDQCSYDWGQCTTSAYGQEQSCLMNASSKGAQDCRNTLLPAC